MKNKAKDFYNSLYALPPSENDFERFGNELLDSFIEELRKHQRTVVWNYGLDSVIFSDKLEKIKEEFFEHTNNKSNSDESSGAGTDGNDEEDTALHVSDQ